ncbi:hypothetical protein GCM10028821_12050 [Hymenobacter jeollabukensis]
MGAKWQHGVGQTLEPTPNLSELNTPVGITSAIQQTDGKHVVVGFFSEAEGRRSVGVMRYNANHSPDTSFNANLNGSRAGGALNVSQLPSGKLLLVGSDTLRYGNLTRFNLMRLNTDGSPDPGFDAGSGAYAGAVRYVTAIQPDGKILVGGDFQSFSGVSVNRLFRLLPNGAMDPGFVLQAPLNAAVRSIVLQPDGKILVGGAFSTPRRVVRLLPDGSVDNTFSSPVTSPLTASRGVELIGLQPDGKIIIAGTPMGASGGLIGRIFRLLPSGAIDNSFQVLPNTTYGLGPYNNYGGGQIVVLPDGRIVISGYGSIGINGTQTLWGLLCLESTGALSTTLTSIFQPGEAGVTINTIFRQSDGKLLLASSNPLFSGQRSYVALVNLNGTYDTSFQPTLLTTGAIYSTVLQPDGRILIGGEFDEINGTRVRNLARLNADGTVDAGFSSQSLVRYPVSKVALTSSGQVLAATAFASTAANAPASGLLRFSSSGAPDPAFQASLPGSTNQFSQVVVQPDGRLVVSDGFGSVHRLLANGSADNSFTSYGQNLWIYAIKLQPDGKILVAGDLQLDGSGFPSLGLIRLLPNGQDDASFTPLPWSTSFRPTSLALQSDGKILAASGSVGSNRSPVIRLLANGQADPSFVYPVVTAAGDGISGMTVQSNDFILLGTTYYRPYGRAAIQRVQRDGQVDNSFALTPTLGAIADILIQNDGKLLLSGPFVTVAGSSRLLLARLTASNVLPVRVGQSPGGAFTFWPNPTQGRLHIVADKAHTIQLVDMTGRVIRQLPASATETTLDVRQLPAGVYLLRVDYADGSVTRRVVLE